MERLVVLVGALVPTQRDREWITGRMATRRTFLGTIAPVALAGCTRDVGEELPPNRRQPTSEVRPSLPVPERHDVLVTGIETTAGESIEDLDALAEVLATQDVDVIRADEDRTLLRLAVTGRAVARGNYHAVGPVAGAFPTSLEAVDGIAGLHLAIRPTEGSSIGVATIGKPLARRYRSGGHTVHEYAELVADTVRTEGTP